jgi:tRNA-Thr(GGU) m(6)t(6)A37 methyltransferase TsaA
MPFRIGRKQAGPQGAAAEIRIQPVAFVHNRASKPRTSGWQDVESTITLADGIDAEMLAELGGFSHIIVVFWLDRLGDDRPRPARIPVTDAEPGIFATRSQLRPNPIGVSAVALKAVSGRTLRVQGLDALDGTPVVDLKPYIPYYDSKPSASVPRWVYGD